MNPGHWDSLTWDTLTGRVKDGKCTPFLGAGAVVPALPLGSTVAHEWATTHHYPLDDDYDLARVAQYLSIHRDDAMWPKDEIAKQIKALPLPDVTNPAEVHAVLARLPLAIYITTNYDHSMFEALCAAGKNPHREICRWNASPAVEAEPSPFADPGYAPTPAAPLVYHLHGHVDLPESIVLTEDDYLDFLVTVTRDPNLLPHQIKRALSGNSLLFIGYRLADWDFRVIHRGLVASVAASLRRLNVTVQLSDSEAAREYLSRYYEGLPARVYWGTAAQFTQELDGHVHDYATA
jgi:SIR2-like protein